MSRKARSTTAAFLLISLSGFIQVTPANNAGLSISEPAPAKAAPIFIFHSDEFWLNLHHFLYVLGRAQNKTRDAAREAVVHAPEDQERGLATLKPNEQTTWREAVNFYAAGPSKKEIVFEAPWPALTLTLANADEKKLPPGVEPTLATVLNHVAPIYRKAWWPKHRDANRAWQKSIETLVAQHGKAVLEFITGKYQMKWPSAGYGVHITAFCNWAGAYSTDGHLLVVSSLHAGNQRADGLEIVFHEGMHQWDDAVDELLRAQARGRVVPKDLSHGLVFFTAGEAVRRVFPAHVPVGQVSGVWNRGLAPFRKAIEEVWKPYLDGKGTRDEALAELIGRVGSS
jgi:hypothetical protein